MSRSRLSLQAVCDCSPRPPLHYKPLWYGFSWVLKLSVLLNAYRWMHPIGVMAPVGNASIAARKADAARAMKEST